MEIQDIAKYLALKGIFTSNCYDSDKKQFYVNLETKAKSHLYLYQDGLLVGRYDYQKQIDLNQDVEDIVTELCHELNYALHKNGCCQSAWADLCAARGVNLEIYY